jgi:hypothetical protein
MEKCINVLKKYNIEYKIKGMKFWIWGSSEPYSFFLWNIYYNRRW